MSDGFSSAEVKKFSFFMRTSYYITNLQVLINFYPDDHIYIYVIYRSELSETWNTCTIYTPLLIERMTSLILINCSAYRSPYSHRNTIHRCNRCHDIRGPSLLRRIPGWRTAKVRSTRDYQTSRTVDAKCKGAFRLNPGAALVIGGLGAQSKVEGISEFRSKDLSIFMEKNSYNVR